LVSGVRRTKNPQALSCANNPWYRAPTQSQDIICLFIAKQHGTILKGAKGAGRCRHETGFAVFGGDFVIFCAKGAALPMQGKDGKRKKREINPKDATIRS
jgi:hypothetical protein